MVNVLANNVKISNVKIVESSSNTIICRSVKEEFFGINTLDIGNDGILCEHSEDDIVKINIKIDGKEYKDVYFKLIVDANSTPALIINKNQLASVPFEPIVRKEPDPILTESLPQKSLINEDLKTLDLEFQKKINEKERIIKNLNEEIKKISHINNSKIELEKEQIEENIKNTIEEGVEKYKQKLLEDFFETNNQQNRLKDDLIKNTIESLEEAFNEKYIESVAEIRSTSIEEVKEYSQNFLDNLSKSLNEKHIEDLSDLQNLINDTIKNDLFLVTGELHERFKSQVDVNRDELYEKLETYKETVQKEIFEIFETYGDKIKIESDKTLEKRINEAKNNIIAKYVEDIEKSNNDLKRELVQQIAVVEEKIDRKRVEQIKFDSNELVAEAARLLIEKDSKASNRLKKFKDDILKDLQKAAENYTTEANKRMMRYAEMMSGGGSVAKQFANGGTMDGSLNVTGSILSGGRNLLEIFALSGTGGGGGTGRDDVNTAVISNSANWNDAYTVATSYQSNSGSYVNNITFNNYQTSVASSTAILLPISVYQDASGSFAPSNLYQGLTSNWNNAYTVATSYQSNSADYATNSYVHNNFFPLSGGIISGPTRINNNLTVFGNLSATGTTTFANTVFTTTSALSVFHVGSGPAMWIGNNGDGDIASFYDTDQNIEILHVGGNNGSFPNVGVKTSTPNVDFTVNGQISANNTIYDAVGNSNEWNFAYDVSTAYQTTSSSFTTNTTLNSVSSLLTPLTLTNTLTSQLVTNTVFNNYQTSVASSTATLLPTSIYQNASGNWQGTFTNVQSNSANYILDGGNTKAANITLGTNDNFNLNFETANSTRMTVTSAGNVGIGTTTPNERLTVAGNVSATGTVFALGNVWIPAAAWIPRTTNGCGVDSRELSANNYDELLFDAGVNEFAQALMVMPRNYNSGSMSARFYYTASVNASSGSGIVWGIQGLALSLNSPLSASLGTAQTVTSNFLSANQMHISNATSAFTVAGTSAANTPIQFQIYRDAVNVNDLYAADARLLGVEILYN